MLVTVPDLRRELSGERPPTLLDVRWRLGEPDGRPAYLAGHLPGAAYVDLERDLADPPRPDRVGGRHPLPAAERFAAAMRRCGVRSDRPVVVYDDAGGTSAARCWWLLRHHGHDAVSVLDGGLGAWRETGLPLESGQPAIEPGDVVAVPGRSRVLDAADVQRLLDAGGLLLDARAGERYRGEVEPVDPVAGHVPGAVSAPTTDLIGADGRLDRAAVQRLRETAGERPVAVYCGSGVTASHTVLALAAAGLDAALYAGSWSDWTADPARPVATGGSAG